jgi:hypothetical protein
MTKSKSITINTLITQISKKLVCKPISKSKLLQIAQILNISVAEPKPKTKKTAVKVDPGYLKKMTAVLKRDNQLDFIDEAEGKHLIDEMALMKDKAFLRSLPKRLPKKTAKKTAKKPHSDPKHLTGKALYDKIRYLINSRPKSYDPMPDFYDYKTKSLLDLASDDEKKPNKQTFTTINGEFQKLIFATDPFYNKARIENKKLDKRKKDKLSKSLGGFENDADKDEPFVPFSQAELKMKKSDKEDLLKDYRIESELKYAGTLKDIFNEANSLIKRYKNSDRRIIMKELIEPNTGMSGEVARLSEHKRFSKTSKKRTVLTYLYAKHSDKESLRIESKKKK